MRLVSQDGTIDVPYEKCCISIDYRCDTNIIAWSFGCKDEEIANMATYSTKDKCLKVMEMLRETSYWIKAAFVFPKDDEVVVDG